MKLKLFTPWLFDGNVVINIQDYGYNATDWSRMDDEEKRSVASDIVLKLMEFDYEEI